MLKDLVYGLRDLVYPPNCSICEHVISSQLSQRSLCPQCINNIIPNKPPFCPRCSRYLGQNIKHSLCHECRKHSLHFDFAWSACLYENPLKNLIYAFKYGQKTHYRRCFAQIMIDFVYKYNLDIHQFDFIAPIPLFSSRLRERGYNQSYLLSAMIAEHFKIPLSTNALIRTRNSQSQTLFDKKERFTNISGAFTIKHPLEIRKKSILIIDDLLTTGATASEAALMLKNAQAKKAAVFTLAITT